MVVQKEAFDLDLQHFNSLTRTEPQRFCLRGSSYCHDMEEVEEISGPGHQRWSWWTNRPPQTHIRLTWVPEIGVKEVTGTRNGQISTVRMSDDVNLGPSGNTRNHSGADQWIGKLRRGIYGTGWCVWLMMMSPKYRSMGQPEMEDLTDWHAVVAKRISTTDVSLVE